MPPMYHQTTKRVLRMLRRAGVLIAVLLLPVYALSLTERLAIPAQWRDITPGQTHAQVRSLLRDSGLQDTQCEWLGSENSVRCTLVGRHHACGIAVGFESDAAGAPVEYVSIHEPVYTGPFHLHARLKRHLDRNQVVGVR